MDILLVDDTRINRLIIGKQLEDLGHRIRFADDGVEAVQAYLEQAPDLIIMDVMMPRMDGYEAAVQIRQIGGEDGWIPIIFLSAMVDDVDVERGIEAGGDDYLTKPVSPVVLRAKVSAMERIASMRQTLASYAQSLSRLHGEQEEELALARHVFDQLTATGEQMPAWLRVMSRPNSRFSGDIIACAQAPDGAWQIMLGDATGHGLSAALTLLPLTDLFYALCGRGVPLAELVTRLNDRLCSLLPTGRFVAAVVVQIDPAEQFLRAWNGGLPPALVVSDDGLTRAELASASLPLGVAPSDTLPAITSHRFDQSDRLYIYSDGLTDATDRHGQSFAAQLPALFNAPTTADRLPVIETTLESHLGNRCDHDDISLLEIVFATILNSQVLAS